MSPKHRVCRVLSSFSSRRYWDSPNPSLAGECAPLGGERGVRRVPSHTRVHTLWYSLYVYTYFVVPSNCILSANLCYCTTADQIHSIPFLMGWFCICGFIFIIILRSKENNHHFFPTSKSPLILASVTTNSTNLQNCTVRCTMHIVCSPLPAYANPNEKACELRQNS